MQAYDVILVTGQRNWNDWWTMKAILDLAHPTTLIEGAAAGADQMSHKWSESQPTHFPWAKTMPSIIIDWQVTLPDLHHYHNCRFPVFNEDWKASLTSGHLRNHAMLRYLERFHREGLSCAVFAFLDEATLGPSKGTKACIRDAHQLTTADIAVFPRDMGLWLSPTRFEAWQNYRNEANFGPIPQKDHPKSRKDFGEMVKASEPMSN